MAPPRFLCQLEMMVSSGNGGSSPWGASRPFRADCTKALVEKDWGRGGSILFLMSTMNSSRNYYVRRMYIALCAESSRSSMGMYRSPQPPVNLYNSVLYKYVYIWTVCTDLNS